jgi:hypothetical protein
MKKRLAGGVVAIVGQNATTTESVWAPLATAAGVPIIGGGAYSTNWTANPLYFPVTTTAILDGLQAGVQNAANNGIKKLGATYDAAIPAAAAAAPLFENYAKKYGMEWTEGLAVDVQGADFTAQCVKFKQGGAEAITSRRADRAAAACARLCPELQPDLPEWRRRSGAGRADQGPEHQGESPPSTPFRTRSTNTPRRREFHQAMDKYAPKVLKGNFRQPSTQIWTAAQADDAAGKHQPPTRRRTTCCRRSMGSRTTTSRSRPSR